MRAREKMKRIKRKMCRKEEKRKREITE